MNDTKIRYSVKYHPHDCFVPYLLFTYCAKWVVFSNPLTYTPITSGVMYSAGDICLVAVMLGWDVRISCDLPMLLWFGECDLHYLYHTCSSARG